jgi:hypothetical protein
VRGRFHLFQGRPLRLSPRPRRRLH